MTTREDDDAPGRLQALLDRIAAPLEPLDVSMVDGFLCGVLLQPQPVPSARWLPLVFDVEGRPLPPAAPAAELRREVLRRHAELGEAISGRRWFDPWIYELDDAASPSESVLPWVAGFSMAMDQFPALARLPDKALLEPLALLYRHFDAEDLEDADELLELIEELEPPRDLGEAVEEVVRSVLLIADVSRRAAGAGSRGAQPPRGQRSAVSAPKPARPRRA